MRVAIADDSSLIYSDDYREGWTKGFERTGCEVQRFDISPLRRLALGGRSPYSTTAMPGTARDLARNIAKWKPDLVWCHHGRAAGNIEFLTELHKHRIVTAVYLCDEPYEIGETARWSPLFKFVFTMDACTVEAHRLSREDRANVFYLPPCADTEKFPLVDYRDRKGAFFLGNATLVPRPAWLEPVQRLVDGADIRFFGTVGKRDPRWVSHAEHPKLYSSCAVGLNVHRHPGITMECFKKRVLGRSRHMPFPKGIVPTSTAPASEGTGFFNEPNLPASHVNPRFFEMAACGTLVVSDNHRSELMRMFPMAPAASDPDHFLELVLYYQQNADEAEAIGRACSYLISKRHSYTHRAAEVLIRTGLWASLPAALASSLGEPPDWLTPPASKLLAVASSSAATGPSERWSPAFGMLQTRTSGRASDQLSLDAPTPWLL
jgi:hypothetical protein